MSGIEVTEHTGIELGLLVKIGIPLIGLVGWLVSMHMDVQTLKADMGIVKIQTQEIRDRVIPARIHADGSKIAAKEEQVNR